MKNSVLRSLAAVCLVVPLLMGCNFSAASPLVQNAAHLTTKTSAKVAFHVVPESAAPAEVQHWVDENKMEPCALSKTIGNKTYLLVSRGFQQGSRNIHINVIHRQGNDVTVYYQNVDPRPGSIESHLMAIRCVVAVTDRVSGRIHFVKVGVQSNV